MTTDKCSTCGSTDGTPLWKAVVAGWPLHRGWHAYHNCSRTLTSYSCQPCPACSAPKCRGCGKPIDANTSLLIPDYNGVESPWHQECYKPALCPACGGEQDKPRHFQNTHDANSTPCFSPYHTQPQAKPAEQPVSEKSMPFTNPSTDAAAEICSCGRAIVPSMGHEFRRGLGAAKWGIQHSDGTPTCVYPSTGLPRAVKQPVSAEVMEAASMCAC